ncbi:hypothetical protein BCEP4_650041 [Burkholderia cepacia]|nr:hypothetical protein BCEP4_650041 [Burkholderia cepacia]
MQDASRCLSEPDVPFGDCKSRAPLRNIPLEFRLLCVSGVSHVLAPGAVRLRKSCRLCPYD